ncbi:MAG: Hint domain-containing protein, partial [Pararhodobacter sp.]
TVTGDTNATAFRHTYQTGTGGPTPFSYDSPAVGDVAETYITGFFSATFELTIQEGQIVQQTGVIIQMSNGDMFFRPSATSLPEWDGITALSNVEVVSVAPLAANTGVAQISFDAGIFDIDVPCFVAGSLILTEHGEMAVEELEVGDLVLTKDDGLQPVRWIGFRKLSASALRGAPNLRPIRIRAGALGAGAPENDLLVSPQHRILVRSKITQRMLGAPEALIAAKHLLILDGVETAHDLEEVTYYHFLLDQHQVVVANGAETETLFTGPQALLSIGHDARQEILSLFPELLDIDYRAEPARPLSNGRLGRALALRHHRNGKALVA